MHDQQERGEGRRERGVVRRRQRNASGHPDRFRRSQQTQARQEGNARAPRRGSEDPRQSMVNWKSICVRDERKVHFFAHEQNSVCLLNVGSHEDQ